MVWLSTVSRSRGLDTESGMAPRPLALRDFGLPSWALCPTGPICNRRGMAGGPGSGCDLGRQASS